ncbi:MAG: YegS/Rv2252/BmrU family lipid kinase [Clostridia bacterium]|nr:YegS/Rv2252/BmrU family lipid kinase [Clostridia bacterium]
MRHVFVINPAAGKENAQEKIRRALETLKNPVDYEIYLTKDTRDATFFVRNYCERYHDPVRFYACGGDGTLNEVMNGIVGFSHASLGCYPCGSGNDFVKYYGGKKYFLNIAALVAAEEEPIDIMRVGNKYAINATHFGFDSGVAKTMSNVRRNKVFGGKNAYTTGVVVALATSMWNKCRVTADGEVLNPKGRILLCTVANGQYVGGSFRCAPRSENNDGFLEVCLVHPVSHFRFLQLMSDYRDGKHLEGDKFKNFVVYRRAKRIRVQAPEGFVYSLDGELVECNDFTIEVMPGAIRFARPAGAYPVVFSNPVSVQPTLVTK